MRTFSYRTVRALTVSTVTEGFSAQKQRTAAAVVALGKTCLHRTQQRGFAKVRDVKELGSGGQEVFFTGSSPLGDPAEEGGARSGLDHKVIDERTLKLGKTIRVLQERLPTLLTTPLPQEMLSPHITLQLFPSTHPHLPTVSGRIAYTAALWTSPVAWGRVPVLGNVKLIIISERMLKNGPTNTTEKLIVRWKTCPKTHSASTVDKLSEWLGNGSSSGKENEPFHGLFLFEFDEEGRILKHVIEHAEEGNQWESNAPKVISVTDWLLGRAWGRRGEQEAGLALSFLPRGGSRWRWR